MKRFFLSFCILLQSLLYGHAQTIIKLYMLTNSSLLNSRRDGFLIATLVTGENTTICNYRFSDFDANIACASLGYPAQGLSIANANSGLTGKVLIGDIDCSGTESNISFCMSSGRKEFGAPCSSHDLDAYVYCLQNKVAPQITTNVPTICNSSNGNYKFLPALNKTNTGFLTHNDRYICNSDYSFDIPRALYFCTLFCSPVSNPLPMMNVAGVREPATYAQLTESSSYTPTLTNVNCSNSFAVALQCGPEPVILEPSPNVTCNTSVIIATWNNGTVPTINPSLINMTVTCPKASNYITSNATFDAIIVFSFLECNPIVTANANSITNSYVITRSYLQSGVISVAARDLTISCSIPKPGSSNNNITFQTAGPDSLNAVATIPVNMIFFTDSSYQTRMPSPYTIYDNMLMYVQVEMTSTVKTLRLGLVNCKVSTVKSMVLTNSSNSLPLIINSCPSKNVNYQVAMYPIDRKHIGFQFKPYIINGISSVFVLCETTKCYMDTPDSNCLLCNDPNKRRKRSIVDTDFVVHGPIYIL